MIAPRPMERLVSASFSSLAGSGIPSARNDSSLADSLFGISSVNSQPLPVSSQGGVDNHSVISFSQNSASGKPLSDVNTANHITSFLKDLKGSGPNINELKSFNQVVELCGSRDLKSATLNSGTKSALALFSLLPADKKDAGLMDKAKTFHNAMTMSDKDPGSALKAMKTFTAAILKKMELSPKEAKAEDNLKQFCSNYLQEYVYPDIIAKLDGKLSADYVQMLKENPANVENHLFAGENEKTNNMITELQKEFFEFKGTGDKAVKMYSLLKELEHKTQIMAGLIRQDIAAPDAPVSPAAGPAVSNDIGQPRSADGNNAANPGPAAPNITHITNNYNITYNAPSPVSNNISTTNISLSNTAATTKPENDKSQSTAANQTPADRVDSSAQLLDEVDSTPSSSPTENLKYATSANTPTANKSLNSSGTLYGTKGPAPSWLGKDAKVTLTSDGQVRDLSQKQAYVQGSVEQKQPTSLNSFGNQFVGFGQQNSAPISLAGASQIQQNAPQVHNRQSLSTAKDIPVSDNVLNSETIPKDVDGIYPAVPAMAEAEIQQDTAQVSYKADLLVPGQKPNFITTLDLQVNSEGTLQQTDETYRATPAKIVAEKQLNAQGTSFGMKVGATSVSTQSGLANNDSTVILTQQGAQTRDLSNKLAYRLGGTQPNNSSSVNAQGNQFVGFGKNSTGPTQSWINNKGANVVLTQEGAQTRSLTEKDQYRADKFTNSRSPINSSEAK